MEAFPAYLGSFLVILLLSAFVKIITTLSILRAGIGINSGGFGVALGALALALSVMLISPQLEPLGGFGLILKGGGWPEAAAVEGQFRPILEKNTAPETLQRFAAMQRRLKAGGAGAASPESAESSTPFTVLISAYMVSQLKDAFQLGFLFLIPFVVIDLLVANLLLALGVTQMSQAVVALPLKILLFFAVDGWTLISEKLMSGYL